MTTLLVAMDDELLAVRRRRLGWETEVCFQDKALTCLAADPHRAHRVYCGTAGQGLWRSDDGGRSWEPAGEGIVFPHVTAVAVSPLAGKSGHAVVYAGTEPSAVFCSRDGGGMWEEQRGLTELPSACTWSFPPRPKTHHVRWIAADPAAAGRLFVCIEAGALVQSPDGGKTWQDRTPGGPYDTHTLATHHLAPGRLYAAAGDGYFESRDGGATWSRPRAGLRHHYMWSVAVDPLDPDTVLVSGSPGPWQAHTPEGAESQVYRRTGKGPWQPVRDGLPDPEGSTRIVLAFHPSEPGVVYAANNQGICRSADAGLTWERLDLHWPERYRSQVVEGLATIGSG